MKSMISLLCGGVSPEHDISLLSAKNIAEHLQQMSYSLQIIYLDRQGAWWRLEDAQLLFNCNDGDDLARSPGKVRIVPVFGNRPALWQTLESKAQSYEVGIAFPVLHGVGGEDGAIQGLLQLMSVPYVGAGVLGCALTMDKAVSKQVLYQADMTCVPGWTVSEDQLPGLDYDAMYQDLGQTLFVKPATTGSSIGVVRVAKQSELLPAIEQALHYSSKVLVEQAIEGRELECAVLGVKGARDAAWGNSGRTGL